MADTLEDIDDMRIKGCTNIAMVRSKGIFVGKVSLFYYAIPVLLFQMSISSLFILCLSRLLKPLGQYSLVPQILGSIFLGSTIMGRVLFSENIFPKTSLNVLDTISLFGFSFYFFLIGVKTDIWMLKKTRKREISIGFASFGLSLLLSIPAAMATKDNVKNLTINLLLHTAIAGSIISFPVIAHFLDEFRMLNSEFGQVALSGSATCFVAGFILHLVISLLAQRPGQIVDTNTALPCAIAFALICIFIVRPLIQWSLKRRRDEELKQSFICIVLLGVLVSAFASQSIGMEIYIGPFLYGLAIPSGPPLGSAIVEKVELVNTLVFMPLFFIKIGLIMDLGNVGFKEFLTVYWIMLTASIGKFVGALACSLLFGVPLRDGISLGLTFCIQGVLELGLFKIFLHNTAIDEKSFTIMCTAMLIVSAISTPIIKYLQDPSRRYAVSHNQTILHLDFDSEIRILICAHDQEDVVTTLKFIEALNPTKRSPMGLYALHLVEHLGSAQSLLIPHKLTKTPSSKASTSKSIVNAMRYFEDMYHGVVKVDVFTAISTYANMHDEICKMAMAKKVSLIIVPFYKRFAAVGVLETIKKGVRKMNYNTLEMAPCSIGIIIERGILGHSRPKLGSWNTYSVAVLFLSGADDREALAVGARMAGQPNIELTVIILIPHPCIAQTRESIEESIERKLDDELLNDFRLAHADDEKVIYIEEIVRDGEGTAKAMRSMEDSQELIIVGRRHNKDSPLLLGLASWDEEETELGALGDALVSPDFHGNASVLVVQQHVSDKDINFDILEDKHNQGV